MSSHPPSPSSGRGHTFRNAAPRPAGLPSMSERQTQAYLLARDVLRRIQRTSSLVSAVSQQAAAGANWAQGDRLRHH